MRHCPRPTSVLLILLAATLCIAAAGTAFAQPNGLRVELSPFAGVVVHDSNSPVEDDVLAGGRLGLWINRYLGVEGSFNYNPTHTRVMPRTDVTVTAFSADLMLNLMPEGSRVVPYITGGWARSSFEPESGDTVDLDGFDFGGGLKMRLHEGASTRTTLRLDVRDVVARDAEDVGSAESDLHNIFASVGIGFAFGKGDARDTDGDGVLDKVDTCPNTPLGATVDATGCPLDGDNDGVFDGIDACPGTPAGAQVDAAGCPLDEDSDGVPNGIDKCAGTVANARVDKDGCPIDSDGDGVPDGVDQCANTRAGSVVDAKGCSLDGDGDGVPDGIDECPDTPAGADVDPRGCTVTAQEKEFLDTGSLSLTDVNFASNSAVLAGNAHASLDAVGAMLQKWPALRIEIGGHTDSRGADAYNLELSRKRAQSVLDYLLANFEIVSTQFTVQGYGEAAPVASNDTPEGRQTNRRVEFKILNREPIEQEVRDQ